MTAASGADQPTLRDQPDDLDVCLAEQRKSPEFRAAEVWIVLRDQIADELARHQALLGPMDDTRPDVWQARCECGWDGGDYEQGWKSWYRQHVADALLPLIEADRERAVANALAARVLRDVDYAVEAAASLRATTGQP